METEGQKNGPAFYRSSTFSNLCLGSAGFHLAVRVGDTTPQPGPAGSGLSDVSKDSARLRPPPRLRSAISRQKLVVRA